MYIFIYLDLGELPKEKKMIKKDITGERKNGERERERALLFFIFFF